MFVPLSTEKAHKGFHFGSCQRLANRDKEVGGTQVGIVLGDFIFEDEVASPGVPCQFAKQTMVLMQIVAIMSKDDVRLESTFKFLEAVFHLTAVIGQKTVAKRSNNNCFSFDASQKP